ncbi:MAG: MBOAT family O-acyltransferase [Oscillospiraceae bacterium]
MNLNSAVFIIFLAVTATVYYVVPHKFQNAFLLAASYVFYMWKIPQYGVLVLATTAASFFLAHAISRAQSEKKRKSLLVFSIVLYLSVLFLFKYFNFFMDSISSLGGLLGVKIEAAHWNLALPLGISFYTLQIIGYSVDVYRKVVGAEKKFVDYALFVSFFPQMMGPIGRAKELLCQYKQHRSFDYGSAVEGLSRILIGAFKKVVLADGMGIFVNEMFGNLHDHSGPMLICAVLCYAVQLYADFSGYSDMAVGAAKVLGITLRENFAAPYLATNMSGFWSRWHMSLSSWLQDYVFIPLVWSRWWDKLFHKKTLDSRPPEVLVNIIVVFLISGLWHGAAWNFVAWGLLNGIYRVAEELLHKWRKRPKKPANKALGTIFRYAKSLLIFVLFAVSLILFRTESFSDIAYIFKNLLVASPFQPAVMLKYISYGIADSGMYYMLYGLGLGTALVSLVAMGVSVDRSIAKKTMCCNPLGKLGRNKRWAVYYLFGLLTVMFYLLVNSGLSSAGSFIYNGF